MIREASILHGWLEQYPDHKIKVEPLGNNILKEKELNDPYQPAFIDELTLIAKLNNCNKELARVYSLAKNRTTQFSKRPQKDNLDIDHVLEVFDATYKIIRQELRNKMERNADLRYDLGFYIPTFYLYLLDANIQIDGTCYKIHITEEEKCLESY